MLGFFLNPGFFQPCLEQDLVGGEEGVELGAPVAGVDPLAWADDGARGDVTNVGEDVHVRGPLGELTLPGVQRGERHNHQEGPSNEKNNFIYEETWQFASAVFIKGHLRSVQKWGAKPSFFQASE